MELLKFRYLELSHAYGILSEAENITCISAARKSRLLGMTKTRDLGLVTGHITITQEKGIKEFLKKNSTENVLTKKMGLFCFSFPPEA